MTKHKEKKEAASGLSKLAPGALAVLMLAGCSLDPVYSVPEMAIPSRFKEEVAMAIPHDQGDAWKLAEPADAGPRGEWWRVFGDHSLNELERQAEEANQDLKAASARVLQSRALTQAARADWFPSVDAGVGPTRQRYSPASQFKPGDADGTTRTLWRAQTNVAYEIDLFDKVGSMVTAARADQEQVEALFRSVQLALQADVARSYFQLRELDTRLRLYRQTVALRADALKLVEQRFNAGESSDLDVARASGELASTRSATAGVARQRAVVEHSLAVLLGQIPAQFSLPEKDLEPTVVRIPPGLPSALLERRPDVAAAEREMAAANARIGVARSAFFPKIDITGTVGFESATLGDLFNWSSRTFLLGPLVGTALSMPIFDGGQRQANLQGARANYEKEVAQYRQQVLVAIREVEDGLASLRFLADQTRAQSDALRASRRAEYFSQLQYREGQITYLDVIDAQRTVLQSELQLSILNGDQVGATVSLIRALGGGWGDVKSD